MANKNEFKLPYIGFDTYQGMDLLYGPGGEFSMVIELVNPVLQFSASAAAYDAFHNLFTSIVKTLGAGYLIQKLDIFSRSEYHYQHSADYLQDKYNRHFEGREHLKITTYLVITRQVKKGRFYTYDAGVLREFSQAVTKITDLLAAAATQPVLLKAEKVNELVLRVLSMDFASEHVALNNIAPGDEDLKLGARTVRSISLVNTDNIDMPSEIGTHIELNEKDSMKGFPVDLFSFLLKVPGYETILFNQVLDIPPQQTTLNRLEVKKKRHSGIPDPANQLCVEDIERLLNDVARENQLLVNAHFNIIVAADGDKLQKAANFIESSLFNLGIIPSKNAYNQLELFRTALPGNGIELKKYDWFLTTCDAALCLFFKEALSRDEPSKFLVRFTDREGVPISIDPSDLVMRTGRINSRNRFVLGPSGTGKSFLINALVEQYMLYNMDMVIVDTGHSYSGLCSYYQGKYITYTDEKPITMNPFKIREDEYNIEKKDFLCTLIGLLWKGAEGQISLVERDVIAQTLSSYYSQYFSGQQFLGLSEKEKAAIKQEVQRILSASMIKDLADTLDLTHEIEETDPDAYSLPVDWQIPEGERSKRIYRRAYNEIFAEKYEEAIAVAMDLARAEYDAGYIPDLSFNSFYEFAMRSMPKVKSEERIVFDLDEFRYVLKKFYRRGTFGSILNEDADASLFTERFIVFEIDSIKENKTLFPIVTLIIMDVFIQKMRYRHDRRKCLIVEEAWKAIASPLMAGYLLYLYKTVRKFWGEAIVVTQELNDIIGNAVIKDSIINNSDTIFLLDQTKFKDNFDDIAGLLSITDTERRKIFTINQLEKKPGRGRYNEFYMRRGATGEVYGNEVSVEQYLTYTTEKPEKSAVEIYTRHYGTYPEGLDAFVSDLKKSGLSLGDFVTAVNQEGKPKTLKIAS